MTSALDASAAVLILQKASSKRSELPCVLLTRRTFHLNSHAGEVSFPGGKWEDSDISLTVTALRETEEEVGIQAEEISVIGELPIAETSRGAIKVKPIVAELTSSRKPTDLTLSEFEIESAFWLPLDLVKKDNRERTHIFRRGEQEFWAPVYVYKDYEIWGFTARMLVELVNRYFDGGIDKANDAEEVLFFSDDT